MHEAITGGTGLVKSSIFGRDLTEPGALRVVPVSARVALGGTAGLHPDRKDDGNEDVVAYLASDEREAVVVADGHFGRRAAEIAVEAAIEDLDRSRLNYPDPRGALSLIAAAALDRLARELAPSFKKIENSPETSLLIFLKEQSAAHLACIGDSMLFRRTARGALELLNPLQRNWLGIGCKLATASAEGSSVRALASELGIGFWWRGKAEKAARMRRSLADLYTKSITIAGDETFLIGTDGLVEGSEDAEEKIGFSLLKSKEVDATTVAGEILSGAMARGCPDNVAFALLKPR